MRRLLPIAALAAACACASEPGPADTDASSPTSDASTAVAESSSTGQSEAGPTADTGTEATAPVSETDTVGPNGCQGSSDCTDPSNPFCIDEVCVACSFATDPDITCAAADPGAPLCVNNECVQCSAEEAAACDAATPVCDAQSNACVACDFHEQCQDIGRPACDIVTGACFADDQLVNVDVDDDIGRNDPIQDAIDLIPPNGVRALYLSGTTDPSVELIIDQGKRIAIISSSPDISLRGFSGPTLTVRGAETVAYLHRIVIRGNGDDVGISVEASAALFADSVQVVGNDGGGITLATGTTGQLRNCMVGADVNTDAVSNAGTLDVVYTTLVGNFGSSTALACSGATTVRNSILVSRSTDAVNCPGADIANSFEAQGGAYQEAWFDLDGEDLSLTVGGTDYTVFSEVAIWEDGDPPFDFEGHPRPATDGSTDYAGADTIP